MPDVRGRVVIVTGGAGGQAGLGLTATEGLLKAGAKVCVWDNDPRAIDAARDELQAQGLEARFQELDVTAPDQVRAAYDEVRREVGPADTLLNNAALKMDYVIGPKEHRSDRLIPFWELDLERFQNAWRVNVMGPLITCSMVGPDMLARGVGSIINVVTSPHTQRSVRHIPYGPSKAMLETMSQAMAAQFKAMGADGVRVNAILPGGSVNKRDENDPSKPAHDCMVPLILWLASDDSRGASGQVFTGTQFQAPAVNQTQGEVQ